MYWYVFFTKTGCEKSVERYLKTRLNIDEFIPFIPIIDIVFKCSKNIIKEQKPLFPGYVFVKTEIPEYEFVLRTKDIIFESKNIFNLLKYGDSGEYAVQENDKNILIRLFNNDYCIESSNGLIVGTCVLIKNGPLKGMESIIRKIDRHKQRAIIELDFMGEVRQISIALEIMEKI